MYSIRCVYIIGLFAVLLQSNSWRKTGWVTRRFVLPSVLVSMRGDSEWTSNDTKCAWLFLFRWQVFCDWRYRSYHPCVYVYPWSPNPPGRTHRTHGEQTVTEDIRFSLHLLLGLCCIAVWGLRGKEGWKEEGRGRVDQGGKFSCLS